MVRVGIGLPGKSVADVCASAEAAAPYAFDSFSVYGDLYDLPPYGVLHAAAKRYGGRAFNISVHSACRSACCILK